jgi:hypothetical protein
LFKQLILTFGSGFLDPLSRLPDDGVRAGRDRLLLPFHAIRPRLDGLLSHEVDDTLALRAILPQAGHRKGRDL